MALREARIHHALIGGLALAAHGAGRATSDLGLLADGDRADDVDRILRERGYECLQRTVYVANYAAASPERGRVDFLFTRTARGRVMLERAARHTILGAEMAVADAQRPDRAEGSSVLQRSEPAPLRPRRHRPPAPERDDRSRPGPRVLPPLRPREGARRTPRWGAAAMSSRDDELEAFRRDALSDEARRAFRASAAAIARWERAHPQDVDAILAWIEELRRVFGDPPVDRRPWRGSDFRL